MKRKANVILNERMNRGANILNNELSIRVELPLVIVHLCARFLTRTPALVCSFILARFNSTRNISYAPATLTYDADGRA